MKGDYCQECNRIVCKNTGAKYYNLSTKKYYCQRCAEVINYETKPFAMKIFGKLLCHFDDSGLMGGYDYD